MAIQSELIGAHALGIRNVLCLRGDPPRVGDYPNATAVWDVNAVGLITILANMNRGLDANGTPIGDGASFFIGAAVNPTAANNEQELRLLRRKIAAGAAFIAGLLLGEVAPVATSRRLEMLGEKAIRSTSSRYNFVYRADGGWVYAIRALELRTREMTDLMLEREGSGAAYPTIVLAAQRAVYGDSGKVRPCWTLVRGTLRYLAGNEPGGEAAFEFDSLQTRTMTERPVDLLAEPKAPDEMRYGELRRYIDALTRSGSNAKKLQVELALKIAIPFICLLIALFGAPLAISSPKSGAAWGVAASLATTFIVLLMFQLAKAVGAGGVLPPMLAAWTPNLLVAVAAVYLLRKAPT